MPSDAKTVEEFIEALPTDRQLAIRAVRDTFLKHLPKGYEEGMQYGMIGYYVPHTIYPGGYHCDPKQPLPFAGIASQKNHMSLHLMCVYMGSSEIKEKFVAAWKATGKRLDMGAACIRFKKLEDVALDVLGETIAAVPVEKYVAIYESLIPASHRKKRG